jgi:hypothetical protein
LALKLYLLLLVRSGGTGKLERDLGDAEPRHVGMPTESAGPALGDAGGA